MPKTYIAAGQEAGKQFYLHFRGKGPVVMLNLLRFRKAADYSQSPELEPEAVISGKAAYQLYMEQALPFLKEVGSEVLFHGAANHFLIGPSDEHWDAVLLVRHTSVEQFMAFANHSVYLAIAGHRTAALADSRLLPITEL
ncbi:MAG: DUF1330 domain-containing protein [Phaeodactylibacter sp.]|nr:DUF1330 domain-containing protein [Phaeodactylibacter sp.]